MRLPTTSFLVYLLHFNTQGNIHNTYNKDFICARSSLVEVLYTLAKVLVTITYIDMKFYGHFLIGTIS